jgi:phage terminase large subunit GpA-like protein
MGLVAEAIIDGYEPEPDYTVSEWADRYRYLPKKGSAEPGRYRTSRTPYMKEIMDNLSIFSGIQETCVMKATQLGMTEGGNCWFGYIVDASPGPMLMVLPTDALARDHSKQKLTPTIDESPRLAAKIKPSRSRMSGNTITVKDFPGGILYITGANSPAAFRHKSIRYLFLDDLDGYPYNVGSEGDPATLAFKRTDSFSFRKKIFLVSTPTIKGLSRIEAFYDDSDQRQYYVPCPKCKRMQVLEWGGVGWDYGIKFKRNKEGEITKIWYVCQYCHRKFEERYKTWMLSHGEWRPKFPTRKRRGYQLSSLYSPLGWVSWRQMAEEFLVAKGDPEKLKAWVNTRKAETFEEEGSQPEWVQLKTRAEPYKIMTLPERALFLSAGVDVQENRLAVVVKAWGRDEESWLIYWTELYGDPGQPFVWKELETVLSYPYKHAKYNVDFLIESCAVDSGYHTQAVYNFCRKRPVKTLAIKGVAGTGRPVVSRPSKQDVTWDGETIKKGVLLWTVGVDTAKATVYSRLALNQPGPGFCHFPIGLEDDYYLQLTAEKRITRYVNGYPKPEWVKVRPRNEALDTEVYAYAAAIRAGMARVNWDKLEEAVKQKEHPASSEPKPRKKRSAKKRPKRW